MGRPKLKPNESKSKYVRIRVTAAERKAIMSRWKKAGAKNESVWILHRLLGDD